MTPPGSVGVIISTVLIKYTGLPIFDPIASLLIAALIIASVIPLIISSARTLSLELEGERANEIRNALAEVSNASKRCRGFALFGSAIDVEFGGSRIIRSSPILAKRRGNNHRINTHPARTVEISRRYVNGSEFCTSKQFHHLCRSRRDQRKGRKVALQEDTWSRGSARTDRSRGRNILHMPHVEQPNILYISITVILYVRDKIVERTNCIRNLNDTTMLKLWVLSRRDKPTDRAGIYGVAVYTSSTDDVGKGTSSWAAVVSNDGKPDALL